MEVLLFEDLLPNPPNLFTPANASTSRMGMEFPRNSPVFCGKLFEINSAVPISVIPEPCSKSCRTDRASRDAAASAAFKMSLNAKQDAAFELSE